MLGLRRMAIRSASGRWIWDEWRTRGQRLSMMRTGRGRGSDASLSAEEVDDMEREERSGEFRREWLRECRGVSCGVGGMTTFFLSGRGLESAGGDSLGRLGESYPDGCSLMLVELKVVMASKEGTFRSIIRSQVAGGISETSDM
jgi:hypothetical protein